MSRKLLVDTSAWIDHLKGKTDKVSIACENSFIEVISHPMVLIELALGGIAKDSAVMECLQELRTCETVSDSELLDFINSRGIQGKGIGYVDANLLASCLLGGAGLLSFDRKLNELATNLSIRTYG